jgi:very-short-patch-repair endonuclease
VDSHVRGKQDHSRERLLRQSQTEAEAKLWSHLRDRRLLGCKFRRQHRIGVYYVDFICPQARLVIELDGSQHVENAAYDARRSAYLGKCGYRVLRFWNDDALLRRKDVLDAIADALRTPHPASLREAVPLPAARGEGSPLGAR